MNPERLVSSLLEDDIHTKARILWQNSGGRITLKQAYQELGRRAAATRRFNRDKAKSLDVSKIRLPYAD